MTKETKVNQLVARCRKQEWTAQKELYLLFADEMMSIAVRYAGKFTTPEDLVQETFLIFFNKINQFDKNKGSLGAWLARVLINKSFEQYRKNHDFIFYGEEQMIDHVSDDTTAIETLEAEDILVLLEKLPDGCRMIFNLKVIEGFSHKEIGKILEITPSASRSQLTRANKLLRVMISEREPNMKYANQS